MSWPASPRDGVPPRNSPWRPFHGPSLDFQGWRRNFPATSSRSPVGPPGVREPVEGRRSARPCCNRFCPALKEIHRQPPGRSGHRESQDRYGGSRTLNRPGFLPPIGTRPAALREECDWYNQCIFVSSMRVERATTTERTPASPVEFTPTHVPAEIPTTLAPRASEVPLI
jgi:hypothetical protein